MSDTTVASPGPDTGTPGSDVQSWQEQFLGGEEFAELRENETIKGTPDIPTLAKRLIDNKALVGRKGVIVPKEDALPEEWDKYHADLGRPESPEAYEIKPEGLPDDLPYSPELEAGYRQLAFEAGLSSAAAKKIYDGYNKLIVELHEKAKVELKAQVETMQAALQKEWGSKYQENITMAREGMNMAAPPGSPELLALDKAIGDSPALVKFFYNLKKSISEGAFVSGPGGGQIASVETKRQELMRHPAYLDVRHVDHKEIVKQVKEIYAQLHPEPAQQ